MSKLIPRKYQSGKTIEFIKQHEGFESRPYKDSKGKWTIGYGFTNPKLLKLGYMTEQQGEKFLKKEIQTREKKLKTIFKDWDKYPEDAKTAMISYYYNYPAGFSDNTTFMMHMRREDYPRAKEQIDAGMYDPKSPGLKDRRLAEQKLFTSIIPREKSFKDLPKLIPIQSFRSSFNLLPTHKVQPLQVPYDIESYSNRPYESIMRFYNVKNLKPTIYRWKDE